MYGIFVLKLCFAPLTHKMFCIFSTCFISLSFFPTEHTYNYHGCQFRSVLTETHRIWQNLERNALLKHFRPNFGRWNWVVLAGMGKIIQILLEQINLSLIKFYPKNIPLLVCFLT